MAKFGGAKLIREAWSAKFGVKSLRRKVLRAKLYGRTFREILQRSKPHRNLFCTHFPEPPSDLCTRCPWFCCCWGLNDAISTNALKRLGWPMPVELQQGIKQHEKDKTASHISSRRYHALDIEVVELVIRVLTACCLLWSCQLVAEL